MGDARDQLVMQLEDLYQRTAGYGDMGGDAAHDNAVRAVDAYRDEVSPEAAELRSEVEQLKAELTKKQWEIADLKSAAAEARRALGG